ncbi:MAG TPA: histidine kinase, partial [Vitreimonas sp.]|nr:histidine kinase [Vitreimonas sp.]
MSRATLSARPAARSRPALGSTTGDRTVVRLDRSVIFLITILALASLLVWLDPRFPGFGNAQALDTAINVAATLIGAAVAILAWVRWRETREPSDLFQSSAFVALTVINTALFAIVLSGNEAAFGLSSEAPGEAPIYLWTITRLVAALLLVVGGAQSLRRQAAPLRPTAVIVGPATGLVAVAIVLFARGAVLPSVPNPSSIDAFGFSPLILGTAATVIILVQLLIFAAFIVAAILYRRLYLRDRVLSHAFLTVGLVMAAFSQLHFALDPIVASGVVTTTDALRLGFYAILFLGINAEIDADLGALRRANSELRRLGEVEAANAALAERTRLAREIHDGLAQDLWYAKLKQSRLVQDEELHAGARTTAREVLAALDSALAEARQAVMAMRTEGAAGTSANLDDILASYVDDFADRFGVRAEFDGTGRLPRLPSRTEAEILRIVQEALNNVRRHADATVARVSAQSDEEALTVT